MCSWLNMIVFFATGSDAVQCGRQSVCRITFSSPWLWRFAVGALQMIGGDCAYDPSAFHRRWTAADWSNRHSNCNFFPDYKIPNYTIPHHFIHLWISLCHNVPSKTFWRVAAVTAELRPSASIPWVAVRWRYQSHVNLEIAYDNLEGMAAGSGTSLGIPSCRGPNLEIGAIPRCRTTRSSESPLVASFRYGAFRLVAITETTTLSPSHLYQVTHCNQFEDWLCIDDFYRYPNYECVAVTWLNDRVLVS